MVCGEANAARLGGVGCVQITYELPFTALLNEPFLLTSFFLLLFIISMVYVRIDLTIAKVTDPPPPQHARRVHRGWGNGFLCVFFCPFFLSIF